MLIFRCPKCRTELSAEPTQIGQLVRCPQCLATLRVPAQAVERELASVGADAPAKETAIQTSPQTSPQTSSPQTSPQNSPQISPPQTSPQTSAPPITTPLGSAPPASSTPQPRVPVRTPAGFRAAGGGRRYGFNCVYCSSRLEATESTGGQEGTCPTCGSTIVIPILDRYGRLIDPITKQIIKQDPHPVHAYAAAGERAPKILRQPSGSQMIECPRCSAMSAITSNNCKSCGMPFTMEGTTLEAAGGSNGFAVASLVLGIIGFPAGCTLILPLLALIFGIVAFNQLSKNSVEGGGKGMAIAGIILGALGLCVFLFWHFQ